MQLRITNLQQLKNKTFDVLVLGGGINGAVSAAALSARGLNVALIDQRDFAGFTSQQSSNLAWGGIKYMETLEFPLVRKLCMSRNLLMRSYPSTVQEIRFFTAIKKGFRFHPLFLYMGTIFYWLIGNGFTRFPKFVSADTIAEEEKIINTENCSGGFEYSDAYLHDTDARFVFNFIRSGMNYGCIAANYVQSEGAEFKDGFWLTRAKNLIEGDSFTIKSRVLINACGPFADFHNEKTREQTRHHHVFSKGIHLIVDRLTPNQRVLTFFANDGRLFFVIPMGPRTCIGTTDTRTESPYSEVTSEDRQFVLENINARLKLEKPVTERDIVAERCGVRPLVIAKNSEKNSDWVQLSRKHAIDANKDQNHISIFGGKLTDCLNVGEEVCDLVEEMGLRIPYPGRKWFGEPPDEVRDEFFHQARLMDLDSLTDCTSSEPLSIRFWRRYGANAFELLEAIRENPEQAKLLIENAEYTRCEIGLAARREMITKLDDFLRRRSKIALVVSKEEIKNSEGLYKACQIFFGDQAQQKWEEYFQEPLYSTRAGQTGVK
ncbi:MAG: FAD-dependent oxidoreductase [Gammaproteobacteria bacterium]|nr:MAG: FAD-dependent oxidoreductase [Pseudomonadota bacterium]PIE38896.1 MAG: FAD-dependent oxidoreductase [Gammaproteobacteria bacterium]